MMQVPLLSAIMGRHSAGAITSSAANLYSVRDAGVKEEKIQSLLPQRR